ncbi:hypothetical protein GCM10029964_042440 [Kibdelosporangium lantanae]
MDGRCGSRRVRVVGGWETAPGGWGWPADGRRGSRWASVAGEGEIRHPIDERRWRVEAWRLTDEDRWRVRAWHHLTDEGRWRVEAWHVTDEGRWRVEAWHVTDESRW